MDTNQYKAILRGYRSGEDLESQSAEVKQALEAAEKDAALAAWLRQEQDFDQALSRKLEGIRPPTDLRDRILDAAKREAGPVAGAPSAESPFSGPRSSAWWRRPAVISIAATGVILLALAIFLADPQELKAEELLQEFSQDMVAHGLQKRPPHHRTQDWQDVADFLQHSRHPHPHVSGLPEPLRQVNPRGAKLLQWREHPVGVVKLDDPGWSYLYIVQRDALRNADTTAVPSSHTISSQKVFIWANGSHIYLLLVNGDGLDLS